MARPPMPSPRYAPYTPSPSTHGGPVGGYFASFHSGSSSGTSSPARTPKGSARAQVLYQCPYEGCTASFARDEHLTRHERTHSQEKPFQCTLHGCAKYFSRLDNVRQHIKTQHGNDVNSPETQDLMRDLAVLQKQLSQQASARRREQRANAASSSPNDMPELERSRGSSSSSETSPMPSPHRELPSTRFTQSPVATFPGFNGFASPSTRKNGASPGSYSPVDGGLDSPGGSGLGLSTLMNNFHTTPPSQQMLPPMPRKRSYPTVPGVAEWAAMRREDLQRASSSPDLEDGDEAVEHPLQPAVQLRNGTPGPAYHVYTSTSQRATTYSNMATYAGQWSPVEPVVVAASRSLASSPAPMTAPFMPSPLFNSAVPSSAPSSLLSRRPSAPSSFMPFSTQAGVSPSAFATSSVIPALAIPSQTSTLSNFDGVSVGMGGSSALPEPSDDPRTPRKLPSQVPSLDPLATWTGPGSRHGTPKSSPRLGGGHADAGSPSPYLEHSAVFPSPTRLEYSGLAAFQG